MRDSPISSLQEPVAAIDHAQRIVGITEPQHAGARSKRCCHAGNKFFGRGGPFDGHAHGDSSGALDCVLEEEIYRSWYEHFISRTETGAGDNSHSGGGAVRGKTGLGRAIELAG